MSGSGVSTRNCLLFTSVRCVFFLSSFSFLLLTVFPQIWHEWVTDPWLKGSWSQFGPQFYTKYWPELLKPHGNVEFASAGSSPFLPSCSFFCVLMLLSRRRLPRSRMERVRFFSFSFFHSSANLTSTQLHRRCHLGRSACRSAGHQEVASALQPLVPRPFPALPRCSVVRLYRRCRVWSLVVCGVNCGVKSRTSLRMRAVAATLY